MNFIKNIKGVNTLYNLRLVNPSISINGNLIPATYTQPLYNSNSNLYLNFNTNNFNSSSGTLNLNENQTFNNLITNTISSSNLITTTITTTNLQVIENIYSDELHSNNVYASVANIENIISTKTYFENILQPLSFNSADNLQVKYDDITIGLNADNELRVDFNGNIMTKPYHPITSSKINDLLSLFPGFDVTALANFLGIPQAVYLDTDFIGLNIEEDHFAFTNSITNAKLQLAQEIFAPLSNLTIGNVNSDLTIQALYLKADSSATLGNIRCDNINSSGEGTLGSLDVVSMTIQDLDCQGTLTTNNLISTTTTLGNTRITDELLVSADSTMGNMNVLEMNIQTLVAEGDTTLNNLQVASTTADYIEGDDLFYTNGTITNLQVASTTADYIEGDDLFYTNGTITNLQVASTTADYIEGDDLYYTNGTITNLIIGNIGDGLTYTGGTPNKLTLDLDNGLYITNTNKVGVKKGPGLKFNPDASGQLEVNLSETGGLSFYTDKITINTGIGLQITGNNLRVSETQSTLNITTSDISSANLINATISNIAGNIVGQGLEISSNKIAMKNVGSGLKFEAGTLRTDITATPSAGLAVNSGIGNNINIGLDSGTLTLVNELKQWCAPTFGIPAALEIAATTVYLPVATTFIPPDYINTNLTLIQRDVCITGNLIAIGLLTTWQATATAQIASNSGNVETLKNIVDNKAGSFLNTADVIATQSNALVINTSKSSINIPNIVNNSLSSSNIVVGNIVAGNISGLGYIQVNLDLSTGVQINNNTITTGNFITTTANLINTTSTNISTVNADINNTTITNGNMVNITISNARISDTTILNMRATNTTMTSITALSSNTDTASITNGTLVNASISNLRGTNTTLTNISTVNADINNTTITNGNMVNTTITNIQSTDITNTNLRSTNTTLTNIQSTNITSSTMRATDVISTNTTSVNTRASFANIINSILQSSSITNLLSSNANLLTITSPNVVITNANLINTTSTNIQATSITSNSILITNANIVNATIQNFNTTNTFTDITTTNILCSNANLINTTLNNVRASSMSLGTLSILNISTSSLTSTSISSFYLNCDGPIFGRGLTVVGINASGGVLISPSQWNTSGDNTSITFGTDSQEQIKSIYGTGIEIKSASGLNLVVASTGNITFNTNNMERLRITSGGTIVGTTANFTTAIITNANLVNFSVGNLSLTNLTATTANLTNATITNLQSTNATMTNLRATSRLVSPVKTYIRKAYSGRPSTTHYAVAFDTLVSNGFGSDLTYSQSSLGDSSEVLITGFYNINVNVNEAGSNIWWIDRNEPTTLGVLSITSPNMLVWNNNNGGVHNIQWSGILNNGDIVRVKTDSTTSTLTNEATLTISLLFEI